MRERDNVAMDMWFSFIFIYFISNQEGWGSLEWSDCTSVLFNWRKLLLEVLNFRVSL